MAAANCGVHAEESIVRLNADFRTQTESLNDEKRRLIGALIRHCLAISKLPFLIRFQIGDLLKPVDSTVRNAAVAGFLELRTQSARRMLSTECHADYLLNAIQTIYRTLSAERTLSGLTASRRFNGVRSSLGKSETWRPSLIEAHLRRKSSTVLLVGKQPGARWPPFERIRDKVREERECLSVWQAESLKCS